MNGRLKRTIKNYDNEIESLVEQINALDPYQGRTYKVKRDALGEEISEVSKLRELAKEELRQAEIDTNEIQSK